VLFRSQIGDFIHNVYLIDVAAIGAFYADWTQYGAGVKNYLAVPDLPLDTEGTVFALPGGYIPNGDLTKITPIKRFDDDFFKNGVKESIKHSYYQGDWDLHPWEEETSPKFTEYDPAHKYSWVKAPTARISTLSA